MALVSDGVTTAIHFLKKDPLFDDEKPYAFRFPIETEDIPQTNMSMHRVESIVVRDMRGCESGFSLDEHGFTVLRLQSIMQYEDYFRPQKLGTYFSELEALLKSHLGACHVKVFRHGIRKRHVGFPVSTGEDYEYDQPTSVAHIDTTRQETLEEVRRQYSDDADELLEKRCQWINVWKPLKGPLNDWPLVVCDARTVEEEEDLEAADLLYPELATENYQVYYRPKYKWYYLSDHSVDELMVFNQADSSPEANPGVPHCAFQNPLTPPGEAPRESIEVRLLAFYDT